MATTQTTLPWQAQLLAAQAQKNAAATPAAAQPASKTIEPWMLAQEAMRISPERQAAAQAELAARSTAAAPAATATAATSGLSAQQQAYKNAIEAMGGTYNASAGAASEFGQQNMLESTLKNQNGWQTVTPTNPLVPNTNPVAGKNASNSPTVIAEAGSPQAGLSIGDYYTNKWGQQFQVIGINSTGGALTQYVAGPSNQQLADANVSQNTINQYAYAAAQAQAQGNKNQSVLDQYAQTPYTYDPYKNQYEQMIKDNLSDVIDRDPFSYDYNTDPAYQSYLKEYLRQGDIASNNALAQAAARTGGIPSSYAMSAANLTRDSYAAQASAKIPELYKDAFDRYVTEYNLDANDVAMLRSLEGDDWNKYVSGRDFDYGIYDDRQGYAKDAFNAGMTVDQFAWEREQADRQYQMQLEQMAQGQGNYESETEYSRQIDAYNQALQRAKMLGYVSASDSAILGLPAGTPYEAAQATGNSGGGGGSGGGSSGGSSSGNSSGNNSGNGSGNGSGTQNPAPNVRNTVTSDGKILVGHLGALTPSELDYYISIGQVREDYDSESNTYTYTEIMQR